MTIFLFIVLLMMPASLAFGTDGRKPVASEGKEGIRATGPDSLRIEKMFRLAWHSLDVDGDAAAADSISNIALAIAEKAHDPGLIFLAYNLYAETNDLAIFYPKALGCLMKADKLTRTVHSPSSSFRLNKNLAMVFLAGHEPDRAIEYAYKMLSLAGTMEDRVVKSESYLCIGQCLDSRNQKLEAFRNYLTADGLAEMSGNTQQEGKCCARLAEFYNTTAKMYDKATHYKLRQRELIFNAIPVDSAALMWTEYDLQRFDLSAGDTGSFEQRMSEVLDFAVRNHFVRMLNYGIALMRGYYITSDKIASLREMYYKRFPAEFEKIATTDPAMFFRLKAFFCEEDARADSALFYFGKAERALRSNPNLVLRSNFYNRYGQFLLRNGEVNRAIGMFLTSFELADSARYFDYMLVTARRLEDLYAGKNDFRNAFRFAVLDRILNDSVTNMAKKDELLSLEIDHETRQRAFAAERERQQTIRRHSIQYTAITIAILAVFVILIMLGSLRVSEWIIRSLGFISFIFFFEFIILLADHKIMEVTGGEPWKVLLIKIVLIAFLLPMHHAIEKKVIAYLLSHKLLELSKLTGVTRLAHHVRRIGRKKSVNG